MPKSTRSPSRAASGKSSSRSTRGTGGRATPARSTGKSTRGMSKAPASKRAPARSTPRVQWHALSSERKLDLLGIAISLLGLLSLLSLLSSSHGSATAWLVNGMHWLAGRGAFILSLLFILFGLWIVFRNIEKLPLLSPERLVGAALLYLNLLTWIHLFSGGGFALAEAGSGGGMIGAGLDWLLVKAVGTAGAIVVLVAWMLLALAFTFDVSIPELFQFFRNVLAWLRTPKETGPGASQGTGVPSTPVYTPVPPPASSADLPPAFQPFRPNAAHPEQAGAKPSGQPAQAQAAGRAQSPFSDQPPEPIFEGSLPPADSSSAPTMPVWTMPSVAEILDPPTPHAIQETADLERANLIVQTLASFGAPAHVVEIHRGPTVTQFGVEPDFVENRSGRTRVRVGKIASLADDLALALAAPRIRIQAPVPGRSYVGIEVPNTEISRVTLREVIESEQFQKLKTPLRFALGMDVAGKPTSYDLAAMPHLLIAGTTGSGKSVCVNAILSCFLLNNSPNELRLVLVDPKRVELTGYNGVPHLLAPVVVDAERVINALQWMMREMDARYHRFSKAGVRNIKEYNARNGERLPYLVVVIDELADLMMLAPEETERTITRLAQLARATGIHLILATQRPSTDVVTGLIKANFPARIAFAVASGIDSRVILDQPGAERLLGRGDMLFQAPDAAAPVRLQGVYVSDSEISRLVDWWRYTAENVSQQTQITGTGTLAGGNVDAMPSILPLKQVSFLEDEEDGDPLMKEAIDLVRREGRASITMLQRRLRIGYTRAARLVDAMEEKGIIGPSQPNSQVREVLDYGPAAPPEDDGY